MNNKVMIPFIIMVLVFLLASGCSLAKRRSTEISDQSQIKETVPMDKYQELLTNYQTLQQQYQELQKKQHLTNMPPALPLSESEGPNSSPLAETVDLAQNKENKGSSHKKSPDAVADEDQIEEATEGLIGAIQLLESKHYGEAMKQLQLWEKSPYKQIQVRAKYYMGEILFLQKEYDLAMQVFEVVVNEFAYSGFALKSLEKLALCTKELNLKVKYERYQSLLQQFLSGGPLSGPTS